MPAPAVTRRTRAPRGVVSDRPVLMRLMPNERAALVRHAQTANVTLSAFARRMTLAGISQFESDALAKRVTVVSGQG